MMASLRSLVYDTGNWQMGLGRMQSVGKKDKKRFLLNITFKAFVLFFFVKYNFACIFVCLCAPIFSKIFRLETFLN